MAQVGARGAAILAVNRLAGDAHHDHVRFHIFHDNGVRADPCIFAHSDCSQYFCARADHHAVLQGGVALAGPGAHPAQRDSVIKGDICADLGGFADHHAHAMIDEQARPDGRAGVDFDACQTARHLGQHAGRGLQPGLPQAVVEAVQPDRVQPGIG